MAKKGAEIDEFSNKEFNTLMNILHIAFESGERFEDVLQKTFAHAREELEKQDRSNKALRRVLKEHNRVISYITNEIGHIPKQNGFKIPVNKKDFDNIIQAFNSFLLNKDQQYWESTGQLNELRNTFEHWKRYSADLKREAEASNKNAASLNKQLAYRDSLLDELYLRGITLIEEVAAKNKEFSALKNSFQTLDTSYEKQRAELQNKQHELEDRLNVLSEKYGIKEAGVVESIDANIAQPQKNKETSAGVRNSNADHLSNGNKELANISTKLSKIYEDISRKLTENGRNIINLNKAIAEIRQEQSDYFAKLPEYSTQIKHLESEVNSLNGSDKKNQEIKVKPDEESAGLEKARRTSQEKRDNNGADNSSWEYWAALGYECILNEDYTAAVINYRRAIDADKQNHAPYLEFSSVCKSKHRMNDIAVDVLSIALNNNSWSKEDRRTFLAERAHHNEKLFRYKDAVNDWKELGGTKAKERIELLSPAI